MPTVPSTTTTTQQTLVAGARNFTVVPKDSLLQIHVYRGGVMAKLGHNHVIASHHLRGQVQVADDPTATRFEIYLPVTELTVDEPELRARAGPDFATEVPPAAREGTRRNLLSADLLDASNYPEIQLRATDVVAASGGSYDLGVEILIKDQARQVRVPVTLVREDHALVARGEFALKQSDLGLQPFRVAMGALVVLDEMQIRFEIAAREATR